MASNSNFLCIVAAAMICMTGCGSKSVGPLDIYPGSTREQTISALRARDYCRGNIPVRKTETYQQCRRPGARHADSWVVVEYRHDILHRLQRFERYRDPSRAATRWNDLVTSRSKINGPPSQMAREKLLAIRGLPARAVSWGAWYSSDFRILIGVYLLRTGDSEDPNILEELIAVPAENRGDQ